uniref:RING-type E3 ubiquitin transferase n=1 Tax=Arundo donax TaxID=35708 RepID=A0A0A9D8B5_ARUDO
MDRPKSRTAAEIMQRADPSCKIWFVCKGKLICTRDDQKEIEAAISPLLPDFDHDGLHLSPHQDKDEVESELEFYDEIKEACLAAENLMKGALNEYFRREKADEEAVAALQKAKEYHKLYLEEVRKREELEGALANAKREIAQLRQATHPFQKQQNTTMDELQEEMAKKLTLERCMVDMNTDGGTIGQLIEPQKEYVQKQLDHDNSARELQVPLNQTKLTTYSLSSVIQSPFDEDCIPSYFFCPILQEVMRDP